MKRNFGDFPLPHVLVYPNGQETSSNKISKADNWRLEITKTIIYTVHITTTQFTQRRADKKIWLILLHRVDRQSS